jgi:methylglyoxal synthase
MGHSGGVEQIASMVSFNEVDLVFYFRSTDPSKEIHEGESMLLRLCDVYNVPLATNIATAEVLVIELEGGSLNWREFVNPRSECNIKKRRPV